MGVQNQSVHRHLDDMDQYKTCDGVNYNLLSGTWIDAPAQAKVDERNPYAIDPNMKYPSEFSEFMAFDGDWDLYGAHSMAFEDHTMITYEKVCDIFKKRQDIEKKKQQAKLETLRVKWQKELEKRFEERKVEQHTVDTTNIDDMMAIFHDMGGVSSQDEDSMKQELMGDFNELQEILGDIDYDELAAIKSVNPALFVVIVQKILNFLRFLARVPIKNDDGQITHTMDLYQKVVDTLTKNSKNGDGTVPGWVNWISYIFDMGKNLDNVISKVELGEIADIADLLTNGE